MMHNLSGDSSTAFTMVTTRSLTRKSIQHAPEALTNSQQQTSSTTQTAQYISQRSSGTPEIAETSLISLDLLAAACALDQIADKLGMTAKHKGSPALQRLVLEMGEYAGRYQYWEIVKDILDCNIEVYGRVKILKEEINVAVAVGRTALS